MNPSKIVISAIFALAPFVGSPAHSEDLESYNAVIKDGLGVIQTSVSSGKTILVPIATVQGLMRVSSCDFVDLNSRNTPVSVPGCLLSKDQKEQIEKSRKASERIRRVSMRSSEEPTDKISSAMKNCTDIFLRNAKEVFSEPRQKDLLLSMSVVTVGVDLMDFSPLSMDTKTLQEAELLPQDLSRVLHFEERDLGGYSPITMNNLRTALFLTKDGCQGVLTTDAIRKRLEDAFADFTRRKLLPKECNGRKENEEHCKPIEAALSRLQKGSCDGAPTVKSGDVSRPAAAAVTSGK